MTAGMRLRRLLLLAFFAYVALDLGCPMVPGAFSFDPADSVDAVSAYRARSPVFPRVFALASSIENVGVPLDTAGDGADVRPAGLSPVGWRPHAVRDQATPPGPHTSADDH